MASTGKPVGWLAHRRPGWCARAAHASGQDGASLARKPSGCRRYRSREPPALATLRPPLVHRLPAAPRWAHRPPAPGAPPRWRRCTRLSIPSLRISPPTFLSKVQFQCVIDVRHSHLPYSTQIVHLLGGAFRTPRHQTQIPIPG